MSNLQSSLEQNNPEPKPSRPYIPGYGIPTNVKGTLTWSHVGERMEQSRNYWVGTVGPDARPHVVAVWGVWVEGTLYFGGGPNTRWSRNLATNPQVAVHLESGDDPAHPMASRIDDAYEAKYQMRHGLPVWVLRPWVAFAWSKFPDNTTRWLFDQE